MQTKVLSSLNSLQGTDNTLRKEAEAYLIEESNRDLGSLIRILVDLLTDSSIGSIGTTMTAGVVLKTLFSWESEEKRKEVHKKWTYLKESQRNTIKEKLIEGLNVCTGSVGEVLSQCLAAIARIEVVNNSWLSVFSDLAQISINSKSEITKINVMETIGILSMDTTGMEEEMIVNSSGHILTVLIDGGRSQNVEMQKSAFKNLDRCLEFISYNINIENECVIIMETLFNACASSDEDVSCLAMRCYTGTLLMYYNSVVKYIGLAFGNIAMNFMHTESEKKILCAIEMWGTVAEHEIDNEGEIIGKVFSNLMGQCLIVLMNPELEQVEEWVPHKAASSLLSLIAQCVPEKITGNIVNKLFNAPISLISAIENYLGSSDRVKFEAGMIALGSILNESTVTALNTLLKKSVSLIFQSLHSNNLTILDSGMWVLEKIFKYAYPAIEQSHLESEIIKQIMKLLSPMGGSEASVTAAWALTGIASAVRTNTMDAPRDHAICVHFNSILETLVDAFYSLLEEEYTLKVALSSAISEVIKSAVPSYYESVLKFLSNILYKTKEELAKPYVNEETLSCYMNLIQSCISTCSSDQIMQISRGIIGVCIFIINRSNLLSLYTEAYLTLAVLADKLGIDFGVYAEEVVHYIVRDLTLFCTKEEEEEGAALFATSLIMCIGSLASAIHLGFTVYIDTIVPLLIQAIGSPSLPREAKATIISTFSDISLAIGKIFDRYLPAIMDISLSIIKLKDDGSDSGFVLVLRESLLVLLSCIVQSSDGRSIRVIDNVNTILTVVKTIILETNDSACVVKALYLISDLWLLYGSEGNPSSMAALEGNWIFEFINAKTRSDVKEVRDAATATRLQISYISKN